MVHRLILGDGLSRKGAPGPLHETLDPVIVGEEVSDCLGEGILVS